jgi:uncharacterized protein (DUF2141 family)
MEEISDGVMNPGSSRVLLATCALIAGVLGVLATPLATHAQTERDGPFAGQISGNEIHKIGKLLDESHPLGWCDPDAEYDYVRVQFEGIRAVAGNIRMSLYGSDKKDWLASGRKMVRFDVAVTGTTMAICMPLPNGPGTYAVGTYHDENANTDYEFMSEGYGVSNNAKRGILSKPSFKKAAFLAAAGRTDLTITMRY